jgi:hypothetical protein
MVKAKINTIKKSKPVEQESELSGVIAVSDVGRDAKNAILIVSVVANLFVLTSWLVLQVTSQYDAQFANFLFR